MRPFETRFNRRETSIPRVVGATRNSPASMQHPVQPPPPERSEQQGIREPPKPIGVVGGDVRITVNLPRTFRLADQPHDALIDVFCGWSFEISPEGRGYAEALRSVAGVQAKGC